MTTYTANVGLGMPAIGDTGWAVPVNINCATLDALAPIGALCVTPAESPSASLNVKISAGNFADAAGVVVAFAGSTSRAVAASATTLLWLTDAGTLASGSSWPVATAHIPLAAVTAGASTISSILDSRITCRSVTR